jgi:membrane associated rhomboid family serine protease
VAYGAIPYELTHAASRCGLNALGTGVLCTGQPGVLGSPAPGPAVWETVVTTIFVHANLLAAAGDMVFLALLGPSVERALGRTRLVAVYVLGGLAGLALAVALRPDSTVPVLGAAGAVSAILACALVLRTRPRAVWAMVAAWLAFDALLGLLGLGGRLAGATAALDRAQAGGFAFGLLAAAALARRRRT